MPWSFTVILWVGRVVSVGVAIACFVAFGDALLRRADLFPVVGRLSKGAWLAILGGATLVLVFATIAGTVGLSPLLMFLWIPALGAVIAYLGDLRRRLRDAAAGRW